MIQTFCLHFAIKKTKAKTDGAAPLYLRITIQGERFEIATKRYVAPAKWNNAAQKMNGNTEDARIFNLYLKTLEQQVYETHRQMMEMRIPITAGNLKKQLTGKTEDKVKYLIPIFEEHNKGIAALVAKGEYADGTLERYKTALKHTTDFLNWKYKEVDIDIQEIDAEFVQSYDFYLRTEKNCSNNTTIKYLKNFKKIILICIHNGWLNKDPFVHYKPKLKKTDTRYLTSEELKKLEEKQFASERISQVRDIFLFSCYTGLAYIDVKKLKRSEIRQGTDGRQWVMIHRQKTGTLSKIPLLKIAIDLLNKYEYNPQCINEGRLLPVLSNQKMNAYLKEIADLCGIEKNLTYHAARHTFATTVTLSNGVPIESVSEMLGHKNIAITQHYAKIVETKLSSDMEKARQKYGG